MADHPCVFLLGDSVIMESVTEKLQKQEFSNFAHLPAFSEETREEIKSRRPDLIVYEINSRKENLIYSILSEQPDTKHLIIDLNANQVILIDCQTKSAGSMQALCNLVAEEANGKVSKRRCYGE